MVGRKVVSVEGIGKSYSIEALKCNENALKEDAGLQWSLKFDSPVLR